MGRRSRRRGGQPSQLPEPVAGLASEWKRLTGGELAFVVVAAGVIVVLAFVLPGGVATGIPAALAVGLLAGLAIALRRRRTSRR